jgi:hypothetical protein
MVQHRCKRWSFSSSATVYGKPERLPIDEDAALSTTSPYGATKLMSEEILREIQAADPEWAIALLRYFNPVGAHESGLIGEDPRGTPNNLMPYVTQVAVGKRDRLQVFGSDYDTPDGTGVRDYIHCRRPRRRPCRRVALSAGVEALDHRQSGHRPGLQRAGAGARLRTRERAPGALAKSSHGGRAMSTPATPTRAAQVACSIGRRVATSTRCAPTAGAGRR